MKLRNLFRKPVFPQFEAWFDRRTVDNFARQLSGIDKLDAAARQIFQEALAPDEVIRLLIHAPYQGLIDSSGRKRNRLWGWIIPWRFSSSWILALTPSRLLLARAGEANKSPEMLCIPLENLLYLQSGKILLFAWITLYWVEQGQVRQETVYFNTVCEKMFQTFSEMVREFWRQPYPDKPASWDQRLSALEELPYKFRNMIPLYLLLPGEAVEDVVFRPAQWQRRLGIFRVMTQPRMVMICTDAHVLLAEEDLSDREGSYGWITTFLPRAFIGSMRYTPTEREINFSISLSHLGVVTTLLVRFPTEMDSLLQRFVNNGAPVL